MLVFVAIVTIYTAFLIHIYHYTYVSKTVLL